MAHDSQLCHICNRNSAYNPATVCFECSAKLRMGMTIEVKRTYYAPHEHQARIRFRAGNGQFDVEWLFVGEDKRYGPYAAGVLTT